MAARPSDEAVAEARNLYETVCGEQTLKVEPPDTLQDSNQFAVNCRAGEFKRMAAEALDRFRDLALTRALEQIVRPHLVGEIEHDCASEIRKDLDEWINRLRDGTACGTCQGTGVCASCDGLGFSECAACKGSGAKAC